MNFRSAGPGERTQRYLAVAQPNEVVYANLHGTGTPLNDVMESLAVDKVLGREIPCSSTKALVLDARGRVVGKSMGRIVPLCSSP